MTIPARPATQKERQAVRAAALGPQALEPLPGFPASAVWGGLESAPEIVRGVLAPGAFTTLFGQSGHFKSAIAVDLACSVGLGLPFHGLKGHETGVLYVCGEGHRGIRKRIRAWMIARGLDAASAQPAVFVTTRGADLISNPEQLRATVEHAAAALGEAVGLLVIDTLAANFGSGDENHVGDMQLALGGARDAAPEAGILLVHHTGHGQSERERGSYALIAAADYRLQATYDEPSKLIELRWAKCKDDERPEPIAFAWRRIGLELEDEDGEELSSVVLDRLEGVAVPQGPRSAGLGKNQETALKSLRALYAKARKNLELQGRDQAEARILLDGWRADCERRGIARNRWHEVVNDLRARRLIGLDGPHVALSESAQ